MSEIVVAIVVSVIVLVLLGYAVFSTSTDDDIVQIGIEKYNCGGTPSEIKNCEQINRKLDKILELIQEN